MIKYFKKLFYVIVLSLSITTFGTVYATNIDELDTSEWLGELVEDYRHLSEVSIPGTHDSAAYKMNGASFFIRHLAQTQDDTISNQLNRGIRYLDLRVYDDMSMHHGIAWVGENLFYHLSEIKTFLTAHPREFVIARIKNEQSSCDRYTFWKNIQKVFTDVELNNWIYRTTDYDNIYVGDIRGKLLIIDDTNGLLINEKYIDMNILNVQDSYEPPSAEHKLALAKSHAILSEDTQRLSINHLSYTYGIRSIRNLASDMNYAYESWLKEYSGEIPQLGVTVCDFPTDSLIHEIIQTNRR